MEENNVVLTHEKVILELMSLLKENKMNSEANNLFELATYVDGMEKKLDQVITELSEVRKQLVELQERQRLKSVKKQLGEAANKIEEYCIKIKEQLFEVKADIKYKANSIVSEEKIKGKEALSRMAEFTGVKEKLENIRSNVAKAKVEAENTVAKLDCFGNELNEAGRTVQNAFRTFVDKEALEHDKGDKDILFVCMVKKPWEVKCKLMKGLELRLDAAIDKIDSLTMDVAMRKAEVGQDEVNEKYGEEMREIASLAENNGFTYNSEVLDKYEKSLNTGDKVLDDKDQRWRSGLARR